MGGGEGEETGRRKYKVGRAGQELGEGRALAPIVVALQVRLAAVAVALQARLAAKCPA